MTKIEYQQMADKTRADRFKVAILNAGTYEEIAEKTGVSVSTLVRIASGKTDPKLSDVIAIAQVTRTNLNDLVFDSEKCLKIEAVKSYIMALDGTDEKTDEEYRSIIWKLNQLYKEDIRSLEIQINALSEYRHKQRTTERSSLKRTYIQQLIDRNEAMSQMTRKVLINEYGFTENELSEAQLESEIMSEKRIMEEEKKIREKGIEMQKKLCVTIKK